MQAAQTGPPLDRDDLPYFGDLALDQALYSVSEVELRERTTLAGPDHLDADRAALLVARDDPGVTPVGPHRRAHLVQRFLDPALHVALLGHARTDYIRAPRRFAREEPSRMGGSRKARKRRLEGAAWTATTSEPSSS